MEDLAGAISIELNHLVGQPIGDCWRAVDMQIFEFGPRHPMINRNGEVVEVSDIRLHIQCRWRFLSSDRILFGQDDLYYSSDPDISSATFDWRNQLSALDVTQRGWFRQHRDNPPRVVMVSGDNYGGFRVEIDGGFALECVPCDSQSHEHWRLFGHRENGSHFVITGDGLENDAAC